MADDTEKTNYHDSGRVSGGEDYELYYLEKKLGVSHEEIQSAVREMGNDRDKVEAYLKGGRKDKD